ncbi:MAG TPA: sugar ABC transporter permease [Thermomicrobiales bacterium]|jgi:trehalose/maltose transport system permease protein|nr:sugar ABC transporter permease [Thermomicrobiales bacterium]
MSQPVVTSHQATGTRSKPDTLTNEQRKTRLAWIFLAPSLLMIAIVAIWPLLQTLYQSFTDAILASPQPVHFVGLDNYKRLVQDLAFRDSIATTVRFTVITVVFETILGMIIALVINSQFKGRGLMRTAMLVPWAIPTVVSAEMWQWMYNDVYGVIDDLLMKLHIISKPVAFLALPSTALPAVAAIDIWKTTPFMALLLLAGLQVIPSDVYEAAKIDGANGIQQYFRITLPLLRPALLVALIFRTLDALRVFDVIYVVFGNRPDTMTMAVYNQENIVNFSDLGYGTTISVAIFIIIALFVLAYVSIFKVETD